MQMSPNVTDSRLSSVSWGVYRGTLFTLFEIRGVNHSQPESIQTQNTQEVLYEVLFPCQGFNPFQQVIDGGDVPLSLPRRGNTPPVQLLGQCPDGIAAVAL